MKHTGRIGEGSRPPSPCHSHTRLLPVTKTHVISDPRRHTRTQLSDVSSGVSCDPGSARPSLAPTHTHTRAPSPTNPIDYNHRYKKRTDQQETACPHSSPAAGPPPSSWATELGGRRRGRADIVGLPSRAGTAGRLAFQASSALPSALLDQQLLGAVQLLLHHPEARAELQGLAESRAEGGRRGEEPLDLGPQAGVQPQH